MKTYLYAGVVIALALAACGPAPGGATGPTGTPIVVDAPVTEVAQPEEPTATPIPVEEPTIESPAAGTSYTGLADVDPIIRAVLAGDAEATRAFIRFVTVGCSTAEGLGGPPKCVEGQTEGTLVEVFPLAYSEGTFTTPDLIGSLLPLKATSLLAVYAVPDDAYDEDYFPAGEYGIVFASEEPITLIVLVEDGSIVRIDFLPAAFGALDELIAQRRGEVIYRATP